MAGIITAAALVAFVKKAAVEGWGYVFGGQGELFTKELAAKWGAQKRGGKDTYYFTETCKRWFGRKVVDCSGLIIEAFRSVDPKYGDKTANYMRAKFTESGSIGSIPEIPGLAVWRDDHIGIYIGDGKVVEARGVAYGVVTTDVASRGWVKWGKLADVDYSTPVKEAPPPKEKPPAKPAFAVGRLLKYGLIKGRIIKVRGDDVLAVQIVLDKLGLYPGDIDGIYGPITKAAVILFQRARGLKNVRSMSSARKGIVSARARAEG